MWPAIDFQCGSSAAVLWPRFNIFWAMQLLSCIPSLRRLSSILSRIHKLMSLTVFPTLINILRWELRHCARSWRHSLYKRAAPFVSQRCDKAWLWKWHQPAECHPGWKTQWQFIVRYPAHDVHQGCSIQPRWSHENFGCCEKNVTNLWNHNTFFL